MIDIKQLGLACALVAALAALSLGSPGARAGQTPPRPLLECADVDGNGPVSVGDVGLIVAKFGLSAGQPGYHPLYDVGAAEGSIAVGDIGGVVVDFGRDCKTGLPDTQIALATLWAIRDHPEVLLEDPDALAALGYFQFSQELSGQGVHYIQPPATWHGAFDPAQPEGLVYRSGKLAAQLYYVEGDVIGWGSVFPPPAPVDIDGICAPATCSWAGGGDTWHVHTDHCLLNMGTPQATTQVATSATECEALHQGAGFGGTWYWDERVGWMGHLWNHQLNATVNPLDTQGNGRFVDDLPTP